MINPQKIIELFQHSLSFNKPYHVQWFLTRKCNYKCKSCNVWKDQKKEEELSTEEVKIGIDILRKLGIVEIVFSGGNPLLRNDIEEILAYASKYFITTIYDNGSMALKKMDALRYADFVAISLDSLDPNKNDYIKGVPGAWKNSMEAITKLNEEGFLVGVSVTISQMNINEIVNFTKTFVERKIPVLYCLYSYDLPKKKTFSIGEKNNEFEFIEREKVAKLCDDLMQLKRENPGILITNRTLQALRDYFLFNRRTWTCKALRNFFIIDHKGRVSGCHLKAPVASIFELPEVWDSPKFERLREKYSKCQDCGYLCYIFYSIHSNASGTFEIILDQKETIRLILSKLKRKLTM